MNKYLFPAIWFVFLGLTACESPQDLQTEVQSLIDQRIAERMESYTQSVNENCQERVLEEATRIVDSILIAEARLRKDTIARPARPDRPGVPELKRLKDTSPVAPLFPDSLPAAIDSSGPVLRPVKKNG